MVGSGYVAGTPANSSVMAWLNTCRAQATLGMSSGVFDLGGTLPSLMASFTSATNWSIFLNDVKKVYAINTREH